MIVNTVTQGKGALTKSKFNKCAANNKSLETNALGLLLTTMLTINACVYIILLYIFYYLH